ncbi:LOW QUALITY PROTEIN: AP-3 complex subunit delta-like [Telopea speciosissima]|uniref:LOW QUALITY PROTEIN: AP-3 complex subunit delta-like n=1 Tax=Telopea speciosissima TaxID=54955 RepID=UPI001CC3802F|nr:LOW QUALITY PROTEIN: AP-3 complex subunit delta-like [Telopea speciosissima]
MTPSSIMESLFQRSLEDLIKGIRLQVIGESKFIAKAVEEIRREIKSTDLHTKSVALQKLTYLNSIHGIDMSWASFHVVEVMSSTRFGQKKIGYLAASESFHEGTDVILLITNQLRKDLTSTNEYEVGVALECLSVIATTDLARDLTPEIFMLLSSTRTFVKKKAVAVILRIFLKYPDAVGIAFKRLVDNLENSDPHVLSAAIGVFFELTSKDPRSYLPLAPEFYRILVDSKNNWVLIKVLKIFCELAPLEPRLAKRVIDPICELMKKTGSKSLMFECIRTVFTSFTEHVSAVKLAVEKIHEFLAGDDPNLKYLGLRALSIVEPRLLWPMLENKELVIKSLSNADPNIKVESLRVVMGMVSESNVVEISRVLVNYALKADLEFSNEILGSILSTCSRNLFEIIDDFDWYVSLLGEISRNSHCQKGEEIENQLIDIGLRVKDVRPELVLVGRDLLIDPALLGNPFLHRILSASAWVSGEYVELSKSPFELMDALLQPRTSLLPPLIKAVYIQSAFKVLVFCLHSYLRERRVIASSSDDLAEEISNLASERKCPQVSDLAKSEAAADCKQDERFNPSSSNRTLDDIIMGNGDGIFSTKYLPVSVEKESFTHESICYLINLVNMALGPLLGSDEVEVQERAWNVLGLVGLVQQEVSGCVPIKEGSVEMEKPKASIIIKLMHDVFSKELVPVSGSAQERVQIPDGLLLKENLADLDTICGDILILNSCSFSIGSHQTGDRDSVSFFDQQIKEEPELSTESTSLLAQHRKRHGLYYLPAEKNKIISNDYPPVNEPQPTGSSIDGVHDLVMLTEKTLVSKKKPNHAKQRPVVVKLDEGDEVPVSVVQQINSKDDLLSSAVRGVLLGDEPNVAALRSNHSDKSSGKKRVKEVSLNSESVSLPKQNLGDMENLSHGTSTSRRNRHRSHGKERHRSPKKNEEGKEENSHKAKLKSSHCHSRHKTREKGYESLNLVAQTPVTPDFLL